MLTTVVLGGHLGRRFGRVRRFDLTVPTPLEASRALCATVPGFRQFMLENDRPGYHVFIGKRSVRAEEVEEAAGPQITIMPALVGAGEDDQTIFNIVLGSVLILGGAVLMATGVGAPLAAPLIGIGVSLALGGVSRLLFKPPKDEGPLDHPDNQANPVFNGPVNTVALGNPVPICYGELEIGSQVISAGLTNSASAAFGGGALYSPNGP
jgi:predicted phage tail protein